MKLDNKKLELDAIICALDNLNQNNLMYGKIDRTTYENYKNYIHKIYDINKEA